MPTRPVHSAEHQIGKGTYALSFFVEFVLTRGTLTSVLYDLRCHKMSSVLQLDLGSSWYILYMLNMHDVNFTSDKSVSLIAHSGGHWCTRSSRRQPLSHSPRTPVDAGRLVVHIHGQPLLHSSCTPAATGGPASLPCEYKCVQCDTMCVLNVMGRTWMTNGVVCTLCACLWHISEHLVMKHTADDNKHQ